MKVVGLLDVSFRAQYKAPDRYALRVANLTDDTPFIYAVDGQLVLYNPIDGAILYLSNARFGYELCVKEGRLSTGFGLWKSDRQCRILVDVRSLYDIEAARSEVVRIDSNNISFTRILASGNSIRAVIDQTQRCPFKQIDLRETGSDEPFLRVQDLSVDDDARQTWPVLPSKDRFAGRIDINDLSNDARFGGISRSSDR
jgi:hypothetical protein